MLTALLLTGTVGGASDHPLLGEFRLLYPELAKVPDNVVVYWLNKAPVAGWDDGDVNDATLLFAAHQSALWLAASGGGAAIPQGVTSFKSASFSASFSEDYVNRATGGGWDATRYGAEFKRLLRRNAGGPYLAGPVGSCPDVC